MGFTTQIFLFLFFPLCIVVYYLIHIISTKGPLAKILTKVRAPEVVLILISLFFYNWAGVGEAWKLVVYIAAVYGMGWAIQLRRERVKNTAQPKRQEQDEPKWWKRVDWISAAVIAASAAAVVFVLVYYKYADFIKSVVTFDFRSKNASIVAPIGISFITFSAISYLVDIRRGDADCKDPVDCALYLSFFPKIISGPIVLFKDFKPQCGEKHITLDMAFEGVERIMIGFAKKLIIADTFGACISKTEGVAIDVPTAWGVGLLFMLQLYYDFSGYSDIAIGLGKLLGYEMKENFNFPYLSTSITDFWRRWHISLGTWFKEYVYIPLGGSRKGRTRTVLNLAIVFFLTGLWHGAGWTYIAWGLVNGVFRILEKLMENTRFYNAVPSFIKWLITMVIVYFSWVIFRFTGVTDVINEFKLMLGIKTYGSVPYTFFYYFDMQIITLVVIALLGSTVFGIKWGGIRDRCQTASKSALALLFREIVIVALFILAIMFMVSSGYSPFIYFQY